MNETGVSWGIPGASGGILEHLNPNFPPTKEWETIAFFFGAFARFRGDSHSRIFQRGIVFSIGEYHFPSGRLFLKPYGSVFCCTSALK